MRRKIQARLRKSVRLAEHRHPDYAKLFHRLERECRVDRALTRVVVDTACNLKLRGLAARLLRDVAGNTSAFVPLLAECIAGRDAKLTGLREVIHFMGYGRGHLTRPEFEILQATLLTGTPQQQYWVVNELAFFDRRQVPRVLIRTLDHTTAPAYVRGWAAERLHLHVSQRAVHACLHAVGDPGAEVRLWAVFTLGQAASVRPVFRPEILPVLERMLADDEVVPGWWSVRREAQSNLVSLRGDLEEVRRFQAEIEEILKDPDASSEDKHWAGFNS